MARFVLLSLLVCLLPAFSLRAHPTVPDTPRAQQLLAQLAAQPPDTARVRLLWQLSQEMQEYAPKQAVAYGQAGVKLARRLRDPASLTRCLNSLGGTYTTLANDIRALHCHREALQLARQRRDYDAMVRSYNHLACVHLGRADTLTGWQHYRQAEALLAQAAVTCQTRITLLSNISELWAEQGHRPQALRYARRAIDLARQCQDTLAEAQYEAFMSSYDAQELRLSRAATRLQRAVTITRRLHCPRYEAAYLAALSTVLLQQNRLAESLRHATHALRIGRLIDDPTRVLAAYRCIAEVHAARQQYQQTVTWQQRYFDLYDSLNNHTRLNTLVALQTLYRTQDQARRIRLLEQREQLQRARNQTQLLAIGGLLLGLLAAAGLYYQLRRNQAALAANHALLQMATRNLQAVSASKDRLYSIVAHDLRGPVTAFVGVTELIDFYLRQGDEAGLRRLPALVRQSAHTLNHLLDNLLNWAVTQTDELAYRPEPLAVAALLAEHVALHQASAEAKQVTLAAQCPPDLTVWADPNMTRTILRNLIANALKFTAPGGYIQLSAAPGEPDYVVLTCQDDGAGMSPAQLDQLVTAAPPPLAVAVPGTETSIGLGFRLCHAFVARQGGTLTIRSAPQAGTRVTVRLPAHPPARL